MQSQVPSDRYVPTEEEAGRWWGSLTRGEREVVSRHMRSLMIDDDTLPQVNNGSTARTQLSIAYKKAADRGLFGGLFSRAYRQKVEKRRGLEILYLLAHGGDPAHMYKTVFGTNLETVRALWDAVNDHDLVRFKDLLADDFRWEGDNLRSEPTSEPQRVEGPAAGRTTMESYYTAFPDLHFSNLRHTLAGDIVITRWLGQGTHLGPFMEISATGARVRISGSGVYTVAQGKILKFEIFWDTGLLFAQMGVLSIKPAAESSWSDPTHRQSSPALHRRATVGRTEKSLVGQRQNTGKAAV